MINFHATAFNILVCFPPHVFLLPRECRVGEMVGHVLLAFRKHAGLRAKSKSILFVLAFSVDTASCIPNIHSTFMHRNLIFLKFIFLVTGSVPSFPWVVSEVKLKVLGGLSGRLCEADDSAERHTFVAFPS